MYSIIKQPPLFGTFIYARDKAENQPMQNFLHLARNSFIMQLREPASPPDVRQTALPETSLGFERVATHSTKSTSKRSISPWILADSHTRNTWRNKCMVLWQLDNMLARSKHRRTQGPWQTRLLVFSHYISFF
jgi:hypothetical protein